jgi:glycosyltransferase involved in cell wall biosynthesis
MICPEIGSSSGKGLIGGHVNNVLRLCKELANAGCKLTIVTTPTRYTSITSDTHDFAEIHCLPVFDAYLSPSYCLKFAALTALKVRSITRRKKIHIIHGHSGYAASALITGVSARISCTPCVHSLYSPVEEAKDKRLSQFLWSRKLSKLYFSQVDRVAAISENVARSLNGLVSSSKIIVVPPLIEVPEMNVSECRQNTRRQMGIATDEPVVLYVGNLSRMKGLVVLIDAFSKIASRYPDLKLLIALNMPLSQYYYPVRSDVDTEAINDVKRKIAQTHLGARIVIMGIVENIWGLMAACDLFVLPFLGSSGIADYPISLLEVMALGKPVIASEIGGVSALVDHGRNGLLVTPSDSDDLAQAITAMLADRRQMAEMGTRASETVGEYFGARTVVARMIQAYEQVLV